jgi:hypothetical protein
MILDRITFKYIRSSLRFLEKGKWYFACFALVVCSWLWAVWAGGEVAVGAIFAIVESYE